MAKKNPPMIRLKGFEAEEMGGNSRRVRVDFQYEEDTYEEMGTDPKGKPLKPRRVPGAHNSTYLGEDELDAFLALVSDSERRDFLLALGQREWDALEETRLMKEVCANLRANLNDLAVGLQDRDLSKRKD